MQNRIKLKVIMYGEIRIVSIIETQYMETQYQEKLEIGGWHFLHCYMIIFTYFNIRIDYQRGGAIR